LSNPGATGETWRCDSSRVDGLLTVPTLTGRVLFALVGLSWPVPPRFDATPNVVQPRVMQAKRGGLTRLRLRG